MKNLYHRYKIENSGFILAIAPRWMQAMENYCRVKSVQFRKAS